MCGKPIEAVKTGVSTLIHSLEEQHVSDVAFLSVITFDREAKVLIPLTKLGEFVPPNLTAVVNTPSNLGKALQLLSHQCNEELIKTTQDHEGDYCPIIVVMTDGFLSDIQLLNKMTEELKKHRFAKIIACAFVSDRSEPDIGTLRKITDSILLSGELNHITLGRFWQLISNDDDQGSWLDGVPPSGIRLVV